MSRSALTVLAAVLSLLVSSSVVAQPKPATPASAAPAQAAPAAKARWVPPVRGTATIGMLKPVTKIEKGEKGPEVVTRFKIKNLSTGSIALLRIDEYWYDKQGQMLPGASERIRKPILPGEVIDVVLRVPKNDRFFQNQYKFSHANGEIKVEALKKID
ncbi:MAG: hypothetical protein HYU53_19305 [Acidobacteria bacterium]|nr:hypothetical protein [Acidobacteriota bacterium]